MKTIDSASPQGLGNLHEEKLKKLNFFLTSELHISQAFQEHQACPIPTPYEPIVKFCSKRVLMFIFPVFSKVLLHAAMWLKLPKG
jgi:hypothetical protein